MVRRFKKVRAVVLQGRVIDFDGNQPTAPIGSCVWVPRVARTPHAPGRTINADKSTEGWLASATATTTYALLSRSREAKPACQSM